MVTGAAPTARAQGPAVFGAVEAETDGTALGRDADGGAPTGAAEAEPEVDDAAAEDVDAEDDGDEDAESHPVAPAGRMNAAAATAAATPATTPIRANRRTGDPGLRCPGTSGATSFVLISAGLYWERSHRVMLKIF
ncbi:hypothetical protein Adu01nite_38210 [Paractinoplanes durhamensis]|uniref:Uncharacterized protein n=1 Tax=Paractinoplanes durhamensis TaxID=113563 RepID=A0ABQ3YXZ6_9ACTN|nr:hypothetical protein Adu01nite_38210 [Actinoplanes durhamensis]